MSAKAIFTILILTLSLSVEGQNYKNIQKEWDSIKSDRTTYICGEGYGETLEEADQNALSDLISKISVQVTSEFDITESENYANGKLDASSTVLSKVSTYSNATLTNTERLTLSNEPEARVGRYIRRTELEKIFESRIVKVKEYAYYGEKAVKARKIDDALRYFNWSLLLLQSVPHSSEIAFQSDNGRNVILSTWLPVQIDDVLDNIHCEFVKSEGFNAILNFSYEGAPITSIDYSFFDGRNWSNIYSAKDGIGVVELPSDVEISNVQLRFECSFKGQSHIDKDVEAVFKTQKLKALKNAYINIPVKVSSYQDSKSDNKSIKRELGDPTAHTETIYADNIGKTNGKLSFLDTTEPYSTIINNICSAIKTKNYSSVKDYFSDTGYDMYNKLVSYGQAVIISSDDCKFYEFRNNIVARSIKMSFSFARGVRKSFVEDIVFTFDENMKIDCVAFGLNQDAFKDVIGNTFWNEETRMSIVEFLENYKTAYSLKRLDYLRSIFDDDAVIIVGHVAKKLAPTIRDGQTLSYGENKVVTRTRYSKAEYMKSLARCFSSNEFVNIRFAQNEVRKFGKGGELYGIQIKQDYYSTNYGDSGYLFLMVDLNNPDLPIIKVRTWQENSVPTNELISTYDF